MYTQESITRIREAADLVDLASEKTDMRKTGSNWVGLCPFHEEKTGSFHVYPDGSYHCFGCGAHGNVFSFIMETQGLSFPQAVKSLAGRYHVQLETASMVPVARPHTEVEYQAARFERALQESPDAVEARTYLQERGIDARTQQIFHLGFAHRNALEMHDGQLCPSLFRNRLIFPLQNRQGDILALAGRILYKNARGPKYINSSESSGFKKGQMLYGLNLLQPRLKDQQRIFLVEGYFDVIQLYQQGFRNVLAGMGTALTDAQAKLLASLHLPVTILYDGDEPGQKATERAIPILLHAGITPDVIQLPPNHDPDSYIRQFQVFPHAISCWRFMLLRTGESPTFRTGALAL